MLFRDDSGTVARIIFTSSSSEDEKAALLTGRRILLTLSFDVPGIRIGLVFCLASCVMCNLSFCRDRTVSRRQSRSSRTCLSSRRSLSSSCSRSPSVSSSCVRIEISVAAALMISAASLKPRTKVSLRFPDPSASFITFLPPLKDEKAYPSLGPVLWPPFLERGPSEAFLKCG